LDGIKINLIDTAGIRETKNKIEKIGVDKTKSLISKADLVILVLDSSSKLNKDDQELLNLLKNQKAIIFVNKTDLKSKIELPKTDLAVAFGNTMAEDGVKGLLIKIKELFNLDEIATQDPTYLSNARQKNLVKEAQKSLKNCLNNIDF
jgi:tRNA modification GTPase